MPLTARTAQNAKPGRHIDEKGLYLLVKPRVLPDGQIVPGAKSWVLRVMRNGDRRDYGLGSYVSESTGDTVPLEQKRFLTLAEAREKARRGRELAKAGIPPTAHWRALAEEADEEAHPFREVAALYHKQVATGWRNGKHKAQWLATLKEYAFPVIGDMDVEDIDSGDIQKVLLPIWLTKGETARRVRQRVLAVLDWAHGKKEGGKAAWRSREAPARAVDKLMRGIKQPSKGHFAAMPYKDLPKFMAKLRAAPFSVGNRALQFCILTATRSGELRKARWRDFHLEDQEWWLDPQTTKKHRPHVVPLTPDMIEILNEMRTIFGDKPDSLVFPGVKGALMSDATMAKQLRVTHGSKEFTVHGFRSTFRDWAAETGFSDAWAEAALSHKTPDRVVAAYKRTVFFDLRRDKLMPAWASFALGSSNNVVQLVASA